MSALKLTERAEVFSYRPHSSTLGDSHDSTKVDTAARP